MIERIPWGLLGLCISAISLFSLEVPKVFNPYLGTLNVTLGNPIISEDSKQVPLIKMATNFNYLFLDSDLPVIKNVTPIKIPYNEITHHDIYHIIGKYKGAPAAIHDMVETMTNTRIDTFRALVAITGLTILMSLFAFSAKSMVYVKVPNMAIYSALKENLESEALVIYEDEKNVRRLFIIGGFTGFGIFVYLTTTIVISLYTIYKKFNILIRALMFLKYGEKLASIQFHTSWNIGMATVLYLSAMISLFIGSLTYSMLGFSTEDRPINSASELITVPTKFFKFRLSKCCGAELKKIDNLNLEQGAQKITSAAVDANIVVITPPLPSPSPEINTKPAATGASPVLVSSSIAAAAAAPPSTSAVPISTTIPTTIVPPPEATTTNNTTYVPVTTITTATSGEPDGVTASSIPITNMPPSSPTTTIIDTNAASLTPIVVTSTPSAVTELEELLNKESPKGVVNAAASVEVSG